MAMGSITMAGLQTLDGGKELAVNQTATNNVAKQAKPAPLSGRLFRQVQAA
jgi:hypothetical protein